MLTGWSSTGVLIALFTLFTADGPLATCVVERDPATGELAPLAGAQLAFLEHLPNGSIRLTPTPPPIVESNERGECAFTSELGAKQWSDARGFLVAFKPGYVPRMVEADSCDVASIELSRGKSAHTRLCLSPGAQVPPTLECTVRFSHPSSLARCKLGDVPLTLAWRRDPDGKASIEFDLSGFERQDSSALVFFNDYDAIEIGPSRQEEVPLRPARRLQLNVCDWESGVPIEGVHPVLRFGTVEDGTFRASTRGQIDHFQRSNERNERLRKLSANPRELSSAWVLLPGESAAQLTNLPHADYAPEIYLAQRGAKSPTAITVLGPDAGDGACTLYLRRK